MKKTMLFFTMILCLIFTGCSTIMTGTTQSLSINSNVNGAKVYVDGSYRGEAPLILDLTTKKDYTIKIEAEGYVSYTEIIKKKASGWVWGNVFLGGLIGLGVDLATGGLYVFEKDNINGNLSPIKVAQLKPTK
ncbi:MAG: PEGA domain-containing protein [Fusobacteriaceae bacterium]